MHADVLKLFDISGEVAMVTGGARTLGLDAASVLAGAGCDLVITSRDLEYARKSAERLRAEFAIDVLPLALDQADFAQIPNVVQEAHNWKGGIDILVNNAGGGAGLTPCHLFERPVEHMEKLIALNLTGVLCCCQEVGRLMAERRSGKIINIASAAGLVGRDRRMYERHGMPGQPIDYAAAKAGVIGMTRDLAALLAPMGVHVNAISPGGFNRNMSEEFVRDFSDRTPLGRMGRDGIDLKGAVLFLASPASDYVVGHNLVVDGGFSIWQ
ncbi:MAG TPA: SDR family oxidoreductase [Phycisphaerae bacterium]|nr:SDR family oxidoreductase [Phycisphaerae bacterium]